MFTGLVRSLGTITRAEQQGDLLLTIAPRVPFAFNMGASIACHGICLTVVRFTATEFDVQLSAETLSKTNAGDWKTGTEINLEPSLKLGDELGGHLVSGHVDCLAEVVGKNPSGDSTVWTFALPRAYAKFVAAKGSITIDGVSLTVNSVVDKAEQSEFTVNIIPHTAQVTSFGQLAVGARVNIEIDMLARYVARLKDVSA